ncbi:hypothetical protein [uncultured Methanoregula sp.]|uniref:hypothetical protein n=1 Tax=uncultured Methanoregula sp. TaxID=1005933 RepID=UPI002AAC3333|nr:hypothetical protein [uncultured Methanoregula sp.]
MGSDEGSSPVVDRMFYLNVLADNTAVRTVGWQGTFSVPLTSREGTRGVVNRQPVLSGTYTM